MPVHKITLSLGPATAMVALDARSAPRTCEALCGLLPLTTTAHYAKIAGHEFYLHLPLFLEVEQRRWVSELAQGAVAFWPERQLLCVYYGRVQDEDATVTAVGCVVENLEGLAASAQAMRMKLGESIASVRLSASGSDGTAGPHRLPTGTHSDLARRLFAAYTAIRDASPSDVSAVAAGRGVMRPAGRLLAGEAEARKLHEIAWLIRAEILRDDRPPDVAAPLLRHFAQRLAGWYGLPEAGELVADVAAHLPALTGRAAIEVLEGLILYIGRLSLWIDAAIPWEAINALFHRGAAEPRAAGGET